MTPSISQSVDYLSNVPLALGLERLAEAYLYEELELPQPILDLGCGDGLFARLAFDDGIDFGLDPDERELDIAGSTDGPYSRVIRSVGSEIPLADSSVGTVFSNSVLEHIENLEPVLKDVFRILVPSGSFVVTVPSDKFEEYGALACILGHLNLNRTKKAWCRFYNTFWRHYHAYNRASWCTVFESAGFEIVEAFSYNSKAACLRNDLLVPLGALGKLQKKLFNRWILFPSVRKKILKLGWPVLGKNPEKDCRPISSGGLLYIACRKPA